MNYIALSDNAARQVIDSTTVFDEFVRVKRQVRPYAGGMYWKRQRDLCQADIVQGLLDEGLLVPGLK